MNQNAEEAIGRKIVIKILELEIRKRDLRSV
jgi:hypothetical protein